MSAGCSPAVLSIPPQRLTWCSAGSGISRYFWLFEITSEGVRGIEDRVMDREPYVFTFTLPLISPGSWGFHFLFMSLKPERCASPPLHSGKGYKNVFEKLSEVRHIRPIPRACQLASAEVTASGTPILSCLSFLQGVFCPPSPFQGPGPLVWDPRCLVRQRGRGESQG